MRDLSGKWDGTYAYDRDYGPATPFLAEFVDDNGVLDGSIIEPDAFHGTGQTLNAMVSGNRIGTAIRFTKTYRNAPTGYEFPVSYAGIVSDDGLQITGRWRLLGGVGSFEMHRDKAVELAIEEERDCEVPLEV